MTPTEALRRARATMGPRQRIEFDIVLFFWACWFMVDLQARLDAIDARYVEAIAEITKAGG